jgi:hypothetical protein
MVYRKIRTMLFVLLTVLTGCKSSPQGLPYSKNRVNERYCFMEIKDTLAKSNNYEAGLGNSDYITIEKTDLLKMLQPREGYLKSVNDFFDFSIDVEIYLMENGKRSYIILIGKAVGATGIGVDYWNYQCYPIEGDTVIEFSSLVKTPYSLYIDSNGKINHIEIEDNYPSPASGEEVKLDYISLILNVFKEEVKTTSLNFKCSSEPPKK